jgi:hypothetical protein
MKEGARKHMSEELFADALGEIGITGPVIRMDLFSLSPTEKDDKNQPKPVFRQRIVMPVEGFVRSFGLMAQVMQQLEKQGVIKRPAAGDAAVPAEASAPKSKNFK